MAPQNQQPSSSPAKGPRPLGRALMWPAAAVGLGFLLVFNAFDTSAEPQPQPQARAAVTAPAAPPKSHTTDLALPRSEPVRISIPEIAVDAPFTPLAIGPSGQLNAPPPEDDNLVGWFADGATPGERGTAIVAGHVDTKTGPAVFLRLDNLKKGSTVNITRKDGVVATFKVDSVETFSKAAFPSDRVYSDTPTPQLRLITCGGAYDKAKQDYVDNVVAFAHLDSTKNMP